MSTSPIDAPPADGGDHLIHALAADGRLRALAVVSTKTAEEARRRHDLYPTPAAALGRALSGVALMGAALKEQQQISVQFEGDGPLGKLTAVAEHDLAVRGFVAHPHVLLPLSARGKLDVGRAIGRGQLHVIRQIGRSEPYRGTVPIVSGEIAEDLAYYHLHSEQQPTIMSLGVLVDPDGSVRASGGFMVQLLPGGDEERIDELVAELERRAQAMPAISRLFDAGEAPSAVLRELLAPFGLRELERRAVRFGCRCSRERFSAALVGLGAGELQDMIDEQDGAELICRFCGEVYRYNEGELRDLIELARRPVH
ncbi:MAG TPA: Hsp33 family molecular chaperone HslO [Limnochordia bacterium]|nr:Hsp33 family molecular chaperone HslO [Limnochordia bacterium]